MRRGPHHIGTTGAAAGDFLGYDPDVDEYAPMAPPSGSGITGLTSDDSSVTITDNGDGTLDLAAAGGGGGGAVFVGVKVYRSAAYSLVNNVVTMFPWDAEEFDTSGFHDNTTNNTRLIVPTGLAGKYRVAAGIGLTTTSAAGRFLLRITKNGTTIRGAVHESLAGTAVINAASISGIVDLAVGDYVEAQYYQSTGATRAVDLTLGSLSMHKVD